MSSRRPHASGSHLRLGAGRSLAQRSTGRPTAAAAPARLAPLPSGLVGLVSHPTHRPFATTAPETGPDEQTVLLLVHGDALAAHEVRDQDQVLVRLGRTAAYGDLVVVGGVPVEVDGAVLGPEALARGPEPGPRCPEVVTLEPAHLTLWKYRPDVRGHVLRTCYRTACLPLGPAAGLLGVVIAVLRRPR